MPLLTDLKTVSQDSSFLKVPALSWCLQGLDSSMLMLSRFSHVWLFETLWTVACQAPLSIGFSKQESWTGCHFPLQEFIRTQEMNPSLSSALAGEFFTTELPGKPLKYYLWYKINWILKTLCCAKAARHKRSHIVWFHPFEMSIYMKMSRTDTPLKTQSKFSGFWVGG